jgi:hypothetical protein
LLFDAFAFIFWRAFATATTPLGRSISVMTLQRGTAWFGKAHSNVE